jgi:hypothetical protein
LLLSTLPEELSELLPGPDALGASEGDTVAEGVSRAELLLLLLAQALLL